MAVVQSGAGPSCECSCDNIELHVPEQSVKSSCALMSLKDPPWVLIWSMRPKLKTEARPVVPCGEG